MNYVRFLLDANRGDYFYENSSNAPLYVLGRFFFSDVRYSGSYFFREWAIESTDGDGCGGNYAVLEKENDNILISDEYPVLPIPIKLKMTTQQFVQLFDEWQEKVVKHKYKPKEVIIKQEHGQFFIETSD